MKDRYQWLPHTRTVSGNVSPPAFSIEQNALLQLTIYEQTLHGDRKAVNNFHFVKHNYKHWTGTDTYLGPGGAYRNVVGHLGGIPTAPGPDVVSNNIVNKALDRFYENYRGSVDLLVDAAQARQTSKLVGGFSELARYVGKYNPKQLFRDWRLFNDLLKRKGTLDEVRLDPKTGRALINERFLKEYARRGGGMWLTYSYGVKPLAQSIYDSIKTLRNDVEPKLFVEGKAGAKENWHGSLPTTVNSRSGATQTGTFSNGERCHVKATFAIVGDTDSALYSRFASLNPLPVLWELTPWSFVLDWAIDVGGFLRNWETALLSRSTFKGGFITYGTKRSFSGEVFYQYNDGSNTVDVYGEGSQYRSSFKRVKLTLPPLPRIPQFKLDMSSPLRAANAISLLTQFFRR